MIKTHDPYKPMYTDTEKFIILVTGGRGCEKPEQEVLMADLSVKQIKDIRIGDKVMGIDGKERNVIDTHSGYGRMYHVSQSTGKDYDVNDGHIMSLLKDGAICDMPIIQMQFLDDRKAYSGVRVENGELKGHDLTITEIGFGKWVGIELDGDKHYLHPDGTVIHNSGKSFNAGTFIERLTFEYNPAKKIAHQILFTRYTMTSAQISVIPEFLEKVDLDGTEQFFHKASNDVVNTMTKSRVMFRGIHTSSGNQTAKLKSIQGVTTFVVDEAEEWVNEDEFERIMLSIRTKGLQNRVIIIMNPCDSNHWVYKRFIEKTHKIVEYDGVPVQISTHPNVLHIHTSYLDNIENLSEQFLKEILDMKVNNPERYAHIVMGRWSDVAEGAVFKKWGIVDEFPSYAKKVGRACDFGYTNDVTGVVRCGIVGNRLYIDELCYRNAMTSGDLIREFKQEAKNGDDGFIYSESADPRLVDEIALGGVIIYPVAKGAGSIIAGITKMLDMEIFVTKRSIHLQDEMRNYVWAKDKFGAYINEPEDHDNHCFVGDTMVITESGKKRIDSLNVGERVLTSKGYKPITRVFNNGIKETIKLRISLIGGRTIEIEGTPDHKVKSVGCWIQLQYLRKAHVIYIAGGLACGEIISHIEVLERRKERVFDIEVEDMHEFFANDILVHNCIDAARYYVLHQILGHPLVQRKVTKQDLGVY